MFRFTLAVFFLFAMCVSSTALAQTVTPSETQLRYNNEGVLKMQDNDYEGAVARFQSSLAVGELNITYLNLGRSFYRLGRCVEAREAFDRVTDSPKVASPSPAEITTALENFRNDLDEICTATIVFVCAETSRVGVDKAKPRVCEGELPWTVTAGKHDAIRHDIDVVESVTVGDSETVRVELLAPADENKGDADVVDATPAPDVDTSTPPPVVVEKGMSTKDIFGWFAVGSAAVLGTMAVVVDQAVLGGTIADMETANENNNRVLFNDLETQLNDQRTLNRVVIGSAVGLGVVGVSLLLWPEERDPSTVWFAPTVGDGGGGFATGFAW
jgi:hypothetical protein